MLTASTCARISISVCTVVARRAAVAYTASLCLEACAYASSRAWRTVGSVVALARAAWTSDRAAARRESAIA
jgi:hypothetical protein